MSSVFVFFLVKNYITLDSYFYHEFSFAFFLSNKKGNLFVWGFLVTGSWCVLYCESPVVAVVSRVSGLQTPDTS